MGTATICKACQKSFGLFRWRHICDSCEKTFCRDCLFEIPAMDKLNRKLQLQSEMVCRFCFNEKITPILDKYKIAIERGEGIETWSVNYKGKIPIIPGSEKEYLASDWHQGKNNVITKLKTTCAYLYEDCDLIIKLEFETRPASSGNYEYTEWQVKGVPAKRR